MAKCIAVAALVLALADSANRRAISVIIVVSIYLRPRVARESV